MTAAITRYKFTADDYRRMVEAGILGADERVELVAGEIIELSPIGARHVECVNTLVDLLTEQLRRRVRVSVQNPIRLSDVSEPQPDVSLLHPQRYDERLPTPADIFLLIEVADASRDVDRGTKLPLYAQAHINEAWLVDLVAEVIERHTDPSPGGYRQIYLARRGDSLVSTVLPDLVLDVDAVLG